MSNGAESGNAHEMGVQPVDRLVGELGLGNHDIVAASTEQLTHKQVQKARRGRRVSRNIQQKVRNALNTAMKDRDGSRRFELDELFNY